MKLFIPALTLLVGITLAGCSPSETPLIDMCQKITQNLVGSIGNWNDPMKGDAPHNGTVVKVAYTTTGGDNGSAVCNFDDGKGVPTTVSLNGVPVGTSELNTASFKSTKDVVKETANETKEQATILASDVKEKSAEIAGKAEEMAIEATAKASELAAEAKVKAAELAGQASELAGAATDKARKAAIEAAKNVQQTMEN